MDKIQHTTLRSGRLIGLLILSIIPPERLLVKPYNLQIFRLALKQWDFRMNRNENRKPIERRLIELVIQNLALPLPDSTRNCMVTALNDRPQEPVFALLLLHVPKLRHFLYLGTTTTNLNLLYCILLCRLHRKYTVRLVCRI